MNFEKICTAYEDPIRSGFFSASHLEKGGEALAETHKISKDPKKGINIYARIAENEQVLSASYKAIIKILEEERSITPAAEWLIDNFHVVEEQLRDIRDHLPPKYYRQLPKLASGHLQGYPRVYGVAWDFVAHTDSLFESELFTKFVKAYQKVQPLTIGELWALSTTLRVVLIENLRRLSARLVGSQWSRKEADQIADELLGLGHDRPFRTNEEILDSLNEHPLPCAFVAQLVQRLRFQEGKAASALDWLDARLASTNRLADSVIHDEHINQTAANATVRNIITSMRLMSAIDWRDFFEEVSIVDEILQKSPTYGKMDFITRDRYRHGLEDLALGSQKSEIEIAEAVVKKTEDVLSNCIGKNLPIQEKEIDTGYYLVSSGRYKFEKEIGFRPGFKKLFLRWYVLHGKIFYIGFISLLSILFASIGFNKETPLFLFFLALFPASDISVAIINRLTVAFLGPKHLPRLDLSSGIPAHLRTFVVVPTFLARIEDIPNQIKQIEVHYLANPDGDVHFALLSDWKDSDSEQMPNDHSLLDTALKQIDQLNKKYGSLANGKKRFFIFHRRRLWNPSEQKWIGWERKRGKLTEFNRLLRGAKDTSFILSEEMLQEIPDNVKHVITLDADTRLPQNAVAQLVGTFAHPLNYPKFDTKLNRVVEGYGILQPRITPTLPENQDRTLFQRLTSGPCGVDPYASAISDVYQDLFSEGSYTGKGIYNVDVFEQALKDRTPENRLLSHDLFEGNFARCGLLSDVEFFEDFPSHFEVSISRIHRWTRGDWQLLPWILGREGQSISLIGRFKMFDNLRRSLLAPMTFFLLLAVFLIPTKQTMPWVTLVLLSLGFPHLLPFLTGIFSFQKKFSLEHQLAFMRDEFVLGVGRFFINLVFLPYNSWIFLDAIIRTLARLIFTKRKLLEWTTSAQAKTSASLALQSFLGRMVLIEVIIIFLALVNIKNGQIEMAISLPFFILWLAAPFLAWHISLPPRKEEPSLTEEEVFTLRDVARKTWSFFATFVTEEENHLPPDNFQEEPLPVIAHRSSPTNFGLYLLSVVCAKDFGWIGTVEMVERLNSTLTTLKKLPRYQGHFFNWYRTTDCQALDPQYISSVDNGNLVGHLIAVAEACKEILSLPLYTTSMFLPAQDSVRLLKKSVSLSEVTELEKLLSTPLDFIADKNLHFELLFKKATELLDKLTILKSSENDINAAKMIKEEIQSHTKDFYLLSPWAAYLSSLDLLRSIPLEQFPERARQVLANLNKINHQQERLAIEEAIVTAEDLIIKINKIADDCQKLVDEMNFDLLYDKERKLFSIGLRMADRSLDSSYYDLLASEARLLSFIAIAKGDISATHWFHLGRTLLPIEKGAALVSWSGSMFEYLMPSLVMHSPTNSLLEHTSRSIIKKQITYAKEQNVPWGISESAYNTRDLHLTYQYSNFGVPELGLKRGLEQDLVIAPYASLLAAMFDPKSAVNNIKHLFDLNLNGTFGFYEAIDFTKSRLPEDKKFAVVKAYMAHHQGMSFVSIANVLLNARMRDRFHRNPMVQASELLLQERTPRNISTKHEKKESAKIIRVNIGGETAVRRYYSPRYSVPRTHLLSNGFYSVMVTAAGAGYSRFCDMAVTRWREDVTRDNWGSFIFLRDIRSSHIWSAGFQPTCVEPENFEVVFMEDRAKFTREDKNIITRMEIFISPEDNAELRRVSLTNTSSETKYIEVTSYAEIVLNTPGADIAHPAFSNLFIQTEFVKDVSTLIASRRPRSDSDQTMWMAHVLACDSHCFGKVEFETDRSRFIGRGCSTQHPSSIKSAKPLSNTVGPVLDPVMSLRTRVRVAPGTTSNITFTTLVGSSRDEVLTLADKYHAETTYERASTLAWTEAQIRLHYLNIDYSEASLFQQLANRLLYLDSSLRPSSDMLKRNSLDVTGLWAHGISGDLPILLLRIDNIEDRAIVRQLLRAHEYWTTKQLMVDLVILNEKTTSYAQDLYEVLENMVSRCSYSSGCFIPGKKGKVFILRADIISKQEKELLQTVARAILIARNGNLAEQVKRLIRKPEKFYKGGGMINTLPTYPESKLIIPQLDFYNGLGGFTKPGSEYFIRLKKGVTTPLPWINVIANPHFGFHVSESGASSTWAINSRENQLTPWSNDPVCDPSGECFYIFDRDTGHLWSPTTSPIRVDNAEYIVKHGFGYSHFELIHQGLHSTLTQFVHNDLPVKISKITLKNNSDLERELTFTAYVEWVLGFSRTITNPYIITELDEKTGAVFSHNPLNQEFGKRISFATFLNGNDTWTADRTEFLGRNGSVAQPNALLMETVLSKHVGAGLDACAVLQKDIVMAPRQEMSLVFLLGQTENRELAQDLIEKVRTENLDTLLTNVVDEWDNVFSKIQVETPDLAMNIILNRWLLYQNLVCRLWARTAFYQAGGAYGFRDQLQDSMAMIWSRPEITRAQILRASSRQFIEGDVQHWWHTPTGRGVRTHFSDDLLWLPFVVSYYSKILGDNSIFNEETSFLVGEPLPLEKEDLYFTPQVTKETASIYEHCARALDRSLNVGVHGLPLIGGGDWNDGMNRVGHGGKGESVWLAWFLILNLTEFSKLAEERGDFDRFHRWGQQAIKLKAAIENEGWDGAWYRRAFYDDGTSLGSSLNLECQIDSLAQTWGIISGAGDHARLMTAMESVEKFLIKTSDKIILLFTPPFDKTQLDPGYIKGYLPGVRENGGQYSHAAIWCVLAYIGLNQGQKATEIFSMLNPINHGRNLPEVEHYKAEPYVMAADIYSQPPHVGRGGWTWYTGSAGWMYRAGIEGILGFKLHANTLKIDPRIHPEWKNFSISYRYGESTYEIQIQNPRGLSYGVSKYFIDGNELSDSQGIALVDDGKKHMVIVELM